MLSTTGAPGDMVPVGAELIVFETGARRGDGRARRRRRRTRGSAGQRAAAPAAPVRQRRGGASRGARRVGARGARRDLAGDPAPRARGRHRSAAGRRLRPQRPHRAEGSGGVRGARASQPTPLRAGAQGGAEPRARACRGATEEIKVIGLRRLIAQRMSEAKRNIPHFAYVEELDITELESLRRHLNRKPAGRGAPRSPTCRSSRSRWCACCRDFPQCNAHYDAERGVIVRHAAVHLGVATQTPDGLKVPVVHDAQELGAVGAGGARCAASPRRRAPTRPSARS